ncbi:hypothetical protein [Deinococcus sp. AJ005]|uniref:hypothetical protein n=1 Tax=Deinococcus sp. AJ005 TaxID=2652443 RepID=UPI0018657DD3|nr:hypothetical protein [Deinococcus sp. AJ005]
MRALIGDRASIVEDRDGTTRYRLSTDWHWSLDWTGTGPVLPKLDSPFASEMAQRTL